MRLSLAGADPSWLYAIHRALPPKSNAVNRIIQHLRMGEVYQ